MAADLRRWSRTLGRSMTARVGSSGRRGASDEHVLRLAEKAADADRARAAEQTPQV